MSVAGPLWKTKRKKESYGRAVSVRIPAYLVNDLSHLIYHLSLNRRLWVRGNWTRYRQDGFQFGSLELELYGLSKGSGINSGDDVDR